jgi:hypothetical protein
MYIHLLGVACIFTVLFLGVSCPHVSCSLTSIAFTWLVGLLSTEQGNDWVVKSIVLTLSDLQCWEGGPLHFVLHLAIRTTMHLRQWLAPWPKRKVTRLFSTHFRHSDGKCKHLHRLRCRLPTQGITCSVLPIYIYHWYSTCFVHVPPKLLVCNWSYRQSLIYI